MEHPYGTDQSEGSRVWGTTKAAAILDARPEDVYATSADYQHGHPNILPKESLYDLQVERGGYGAGTIIGPALRKKLGSRKVDKCSAVFVTYIRQRTQPPILTGD